MAEYEALEVAKAEVEGQLAAAECANMEMTALKDELDASLAATKAALQTSEESLVAAQVNTPKRMNVFGSYAINAICMLLYLHATLQEKACDIPVLAITVQ